MLLFIKSLPLIAVSGCSWSTKQQALLHHLVIPITTTAARSRCPLRPFINSPSANLLLLSSRTTATTTTTSLLASPENDNIIDSTTTTTTTDITACAPTTTTTTTNTNTTNNNNSSDQTATTILVVGDGDLSYSASIITCLSLSSSSSNVVLPVQKKNRNTVTLIASVLESKKRHQTIYKQSQQNMEAILTGRKTRI